MGDANEVPPSCDRGVADLETCFSATSVTVPNLVILWSNYKSVIMKILQKKKL